MKRGTVKSTFENLCLWRRERQGPIIIYTWKLLFTQEIIRINLYPWRRERQGGRFQHHPIAIKIYTWKLLFTKEIIRICTLGVGRGRTVDAIGCWNKKKLKKHHVCVIHICIYFFVLFLFFFYFLVLIDKILFGT
jgi:hypothetical protein